MAKSVGLALGGGGARGWAHVGVLRALEEADVPIDYLAGTSIGALVGAIYAADALDELEAFADELTVDELLALIDISFPNLGLIDGKQIYQFITDYLADRQIEECDIPFRCVATHLLSQKEVIFQSGSMVDAVRASISIPGVLVPFLHRDAYLVDGGVVNPVPVRIVQEMGADVTVAVNLNREPKTEGTSFTDGAGAPRPPSIRAEEMAASERASDQKQEAADEQEEEGFLPDLASRYEMLTNIFQDESDRWMPDAESGLTIFDVMGNSINMMQQRLTMDNLAANPPDVLIEPDLHEFGMFDFHRAKPMIQKGYDAAAAVIPQIKEALANASGPDAS